MSSFLMSLHSHLVWTWTSMSGTNSLWIMIGLLATGWFLSTATRRA